MQGQNDAETDMKTSKRLVSQASNKSERSNASTKNLADVSCHLSRLATRRLRVWILLTVAFLSFDVSNCVNRSLALIISDVSLS